MKHSLHSQHRKGASANIGPADKKIYKLLMVDVDGVTYEQDFKTEAAIDEALSYLRDSGKK